MRRAGPRGAGDAELGGPRRGGAERAGSGPREGRRRRQLAQRCTRPVLSPFPLLPVLPEASPPCAWLTLAPPAPFGTGSPPWRRRPGPARQKHLAGAIRLVETALSAGVRGCRVGCDFGHPSGCGSLLSPALGLRQGGDPRSEGEEGDPGAPGDPEVPAPQPRGREPHGGGSWLKLLSATGVGTRALSQQPHHVDWGQF